jgi:exopolysaccharide biosynthesis polyprenyl glycosylphosphotransferase
LRRRSTPARARLDLQRRASTNIRRHLLRAARRFVVLVVADLAMFYAMRELMRAVRDAGLLGDWLARQLQAGLPPGILNGWQYAAALFVGLVVTGNFGKGDRRRSPRRLFLACALATALPLWMTLWTRGVETVLMQYAVVTVLVWAGLVAERLTADRLAARVLRPELDRLDTLFVGPGAECVAGMETQAFTSGVEYRPIGFVDSRVPPTRGALGHISEFSLLLAASGAQVVVVCGYVSDKQFQEIVDTALTAGCQVLSVPRSVKIAGVHPTTVWRRGQALVELTRPSLKGWQLAVKRVVDLVGAAFGLIIAAPVMALVALVIKLDTPGPVLFGQERIGTGGRRFRVLKFRTMADGVSDAAHRKLVLNMLAGNDAASATTDRAGHTVYKLVEDNRVTRFGRFLRRTSLDELPQLFNVLLGQMSLVGPRPPLPYEFEAYDHWQFDRLGALPGITGLWQVSGRNLLSYRQMCELDVEYVRRWSLWLDLKILLRTIPVVFFNSGRAA